MFQTLKQIVRIFTIEDFAKNPDAPLIDEADRRALFVGLINSEQITAYADSLTTGLPKDRVFQGLTEAWDIYDVKSAREIIEWLRQAGHRAYYDEIYPLLKSSDQEKRNRLIEEKFGECAPEAIEFADNLAGCIASRGDNGFAAFNDENMKKGILAWDLGRLVVIARLCFDAGYIDEKTAWEVIRSAYEAAAKRYPNWKEFAISYLIGRGMFGGDSMMLNGLYSIAEKAFEDDNSPWKNIPLK
ncbi:MAG: DUF1266 domain-containing protein [Campylobacteraceae bacterium]|nr:DUF1266 domain-containing protein [Campylobacteraceae bacterium]